MLEASPHFIYLFMTASEYHNSTCRTVHTIWGGKKRNQAEYEKIIITWDRIQTLIIKYRERSNKMWETGYDYYTVETGISCLKKQVK